MDGGSLRSVAEGNRRDKLTGVSEGATAGVQLPAERVAALIAGDALVVDVRRDWEWEEGRLAGARHVEVNDLTAEAGSIPRDRTIIFVCRSGSRSRMAAEAFREAGWDAYSLDGGLRAWSEAGLPLEGEVAEARAE
jgi:rhodanese-related sulfurtransferase